MLPATCPPQLTGVTKMAEAAKQKGTVKWFNSTKGFGFITPDVPEGTEEVPEDLFVHQVRHRAFLLSAM